MMSQQGAADWGVSEKAAALNRSALVWDDHGGFAYSKGPILEGLERWRASGIGYLSINAGYDVTTCTLTLEALSEFRRWIRNHPETLVQVESVDDILRARREDKLAVTFDMDLVGKGKT